MAQKRIIGLNIYRTAAIFMMMAAHSVRIQENYTSIVAQRQLASVFDHFLLFFIDIEPIISATFLFIAGFSLTLSLKPSLDNAAQRQWYNGLFKRAAALYGVAIVFFIAEYGLQWPDMLVSAGVLGIIATSLLVSAALLLYGGKDKGLIIATCICLAATYFLETNNIQIPGLNTGSGGMLPLVVMGFLGTLLGLNYKRYQDNALFGGLLIAGIIAVFGFVTQYPNTFVYKSYFTFYASQPLDNLYQSLLALFSDEAVGRQRLVGFWNHSSIYPLRFTVLILFGLILSVKLFKNASQPALKFLNALGSYGLTIYVYHLMVLALLEVTGIKPQTGWQTLLLILALILSGYAIIRNRIRLDPDTN